MMKVLTYNVHGWLTPDGGAANVDMLAEVIAATGADVVGLNEVFHPWHTPAGPALKDAGGLPGDGVCLRADAAGRTCTR